VGIDPTCAVAHLGSQWRSFRRNDINFPGNPQFRPAVAFKIAPTTPAMDDTKVMLSNHALRVKAEVLLGIRSCEELKVIISHHFGFNKHEILVYSSQPDPFIIIFSDRKVRDLVFTKGRLFEGPVELSFSAWDLDEFGERVLLPYNIRLSIEGNPQHAWSQDVVDIVLCDEALIHHIEDCTR
jgi:hypothetical protein